MKKQLQVLLAFLHLSLNFQDLLKNLEVKLNANYDYSIPLVK